MDSRNKRQNIEARVNNIKELIQKLKGELYKVVEPKCHSCPNPSKDGIPKKIWISAEKGMTKKVKSWLDNGGDVNAGHKGYTLLNSACVSGQTDFVKQLLKYPDLHLNSTTCNLYTPIVQASLNGHFDVIEVLLNASLVCQVDLNKTVADEDDDYGNGAVIYCLASYKKWKAVKLLLKYLDNISDDNAFYVISESLKANEWSIILDLLQRENSFADENIGKILEKAYLVKHLEVVSEVSRKIVLYNNDISLIPVNLMLKNKDWKTLELVLKFIKNTVSIDSNLAKKVLARQNQDVKVALEKEKYDTDILSGTMLLASIGGTNEEVSQILVNQSNYSSEILNYSLILSALFNRLDLLPLLLQNKKFNYQTISRACKVAEKQGHGDCVFLLKKALQKTKEILQLNKIDFKNDFSYFDENKFDGYDSDCDREQVPERPVSPAPVLEWKQPFVQVPQTPTSTTPLLSPSWKRFKKGMYWDSDENLYCPNGEVFSPDDVELDFSEEIPCFRFLTKTLYDPTMAFMPILSDRKGQHGSSSSKRKAASTDTSQQ